jgi:cytochrome c553
MRRSFWLMTMLAVCACGTAGRNEAVNRPDSIGSSAPAGAVGASAVRALMHGHAKLADSMRDALSRGDLDEAKAEGKILAERPMAGPPGGLWARKVDALKAAAEGVANAADLRGASLAMGLVARACGDCHMDFGRPNVLVGEAGARAAGVRAYMLRHEWAADRLWDGIVVPSDDAWNAGALALSDDPLAPGELTPGKSPVPGVEELGAAVHDLAYQAASTERTEVRATLYGGILATCAECHKRLGGGPGPGVGSALKRNGF